jgi:hypothetical protein
MSHQLETGAGASPKGSEKYLDFPGEKLLDSLYLARTKSGHKTKKTMS